jgi:hypothetical protein
MKQNLSSDNVSGCPFAMFRPFPRGRQGWLRVLLFPFQAYVLIAIFVERYFMNSLPGNGGYRGSLAEFKLTVVAGYAVSFLVLLCVGVGHFLTGRVRSACLNLGLAALAALLGCSMMNFAYT